MINLLKQLVRIRTDIKLQPSGCSITHAIFVAIYSYNKIRANTYAIVIKLSFGCFLKSQTVQKAAK